MALGMYFFTRNACVICALLVLAGRIYVSLASLTVSVSRINVCASSGELTGMGRKELVVVRLGWCSVWLSPIY